MQRFAPPALLLHHGDEIGRELGAVPEAAPERWLHTRTSTTPDRRLP